MKEYKIINSEEFSLFIFTDVYKRQGSTCVKSSRNLAEHAQKIGAWGIGAMATPFPRIGRIEMCIRDSGLDC